MIRTLDGRPPRTPKAGMLHRAAVAGLPVPEGLLLPADTPEGDDRVRAGLADLSAPLVVRSAFDGEDGAASSAAGRYTSILQVSPEHLSTAVRAVRASADEAVRHADVLVMRQVDARHAGVAVLEDAHVDDLVEVTDGLADGLVGGQVEGRSVLLPRLDHLGRSACRDGWEGRLALLLQDVRRTFGGAPAAGWDVEWADDGAVCWLLQVRPLLRPTTRDELLTLANHAEILPDLPSDFMTSLIIERGPDLLGWYTTVDGRLPKGRDLMVERAGRPLLNLSLLRDILRTWGLPTALLADSMGGAESDPVPASPSRLLASSPALLRMAARQATAVGDARRRGAELLQLAHAGGPGMTAAVDAAGAVYAGLVTGMFALANAHALQVQLLSRAGVLDEVQRRLPTPAGALSRDLAAGLPLAELVARHGHRGVYESDLARPRFAEDPQALAAAVDGAGQRRRGGSTVERTRLGTALMPVWRSAHRSLSAREGLRDTGMRAFAVVRERLLVAAGERLDDPADLWLLTTEEARWLDRGWWPDRGLLQDRRARREERAAIHVPDPVGRLTPLRTDDPDAPDDGLLSGRTLVGGQARGRAWVCTEPPVGPPPFDGPAILVARAVDGGWAGAFDMVDGVVLHLGGDLSHGALILREMGVPTITGVTDAHRRVAEGTVLRLDAASGTVRTDGP